MKRAILVALLIGLFLAVPAIPQGGAGDAKPGEELLELKAKVAEQEDRIAQLEEYLEAHKLAAAKLVERLKFADKKGFTYPAPNIDAREALLRGLTAYAEVATGGKTLPKKEGE
jgi:hypothetical protein